MRVEMIALYFQKTCRLAWGGREWETHMSLMNSKPIVATGAGKAIPQRRQQTPKRIPAIFDHAGVTPALRFAEKHTFASRETLFRADDAADRIYEIQSGAVALTHFSNDGRRQIVGFAFAGELIGASSEGVFFHDAQALSPVESRRIPRSMLPHLLRQEAQLGIRMQQMMPVLMASFMSQLTLLARRNAEARVAAFTLSIIGRAPCCVTEGGEFTILEMGREDIADYVGLATETVCRAFSRLEQRALIMFGNPHLVRVIDSEALSRVMSEG